MEPKRLPKSPSRLLPLVVAALLCLPRAAPALDAGAPGGGSPALSGTGSFPGRYDVRAFAPPGTPADGKADWTGYLQAAIDAAAKEGGAVFLPAGTYRLSGTIRLRDYVSILGVEAPAHPSRFSPTRIHYYGSGAAFLCAAPGTPYVGSTLGILLKDLYVLDAGGRGEAGFDLQGFRRGIAENLAIDGFRYGLHTRQSWYGVFRNITILRARTYGIYSEDQDNNSLYEKCRVSGVPGAVRNTAFFANASNLHLQDLASEGGGNGILIKNCNAAQVDGYYYETRTDAAYAILVERCRGTVIVAPYINGNGKTDKGILCVDSRSTLVLGGYVNSTRTGAVHDSARAIGAEGGTMLLNVYTGP